MKIHKGFTLIELLVAMGIMAVLTGMAAFNFNQSRLRARDVQRKNDLSHLQKALEIYKNDNNVYTTSSFQSELLGGGYIKQTFTDPKYLEWIDYWYLPAADKKTYYIMACLENPSDKARTTDTTLCQKFTSETTDICKCGKVGGDRTGYMYIISQP